MSARIERLEKEGIITGYHAMVDPMKLGYHILAFINLDVVPRISPSFMRMQRKCPMYWSAAVLLGIFPC